MAEDSVRVPSAPGSHPAGHAPCGVDGASRFDPSRTAGALAEAVHDRLFGVANLADPALALEEISDGGGIHEAVHALLRTLPVRARTGVVRCSFCGTPSYAVTWLLTSEWSEAAICSECLDGAEAQVRFLRDRDGGSAGDPERGSTAKQRQPGPEGHRPEPVA